MQGCSFAERQESQEASSEVETTMPSTAEKEEQTRESMESMESPPEEEEKGENKLRKLDGVKIIIGTDVHYLSQELTDYGQAFQHMVEYGDGRLVTYLSLIHIYCAVGISSVHWVGARCKWNACSSSVKMCIRDRGSYSAGNRCRFNRNGIGAYNK